MRVLITRKWLFLAPVLFAVLVTWLALPGSSVGETVAVKPPAVELVMPVVTPGSEIRVHGSFYPAPGVDPSSVEIKARLRLVDPGGVVSFVDSVFALRTDVPATEPMFFSGVLTVTPSLGGIGSESLRLDAVTIDRATNRPLGQFTVSAYVKQGLVDTADYVVWRKSTYDP